MELHEILDDSGINSGAPLPFVVANDTLLYLMFFGKELEETADQEPIRLMKFILPIAHKFGMPGNETIQGHPYYKIGLRSPGIFRLNGSDWIEQLKTIDKIHPYFDDKKWTGFNHYIITFHDNMFECVAKDFEATMELRSAQEVITELVSRIYS